MSFQFAAKSCAAFVWLCVAALSAAADGAAPYIGQWSNGRGETLTITKTTIQFADDRPVPYRDITRATDGSTFELQITAKGRVNGFPGKTLGVVCSEGSMQMTGYSSHADYMQGGEVQFEVTWERDGPDDDAADDE